MEFLRPTFCALQWPRSRRRVAPKVLVMGVNQDLVDGPGRIGKRKQQLVMDETPVWRREFVEVVENDAVAITRR